MPSFRFIALAASLAASGAVQSAAAQAAQPSSTSADQQRVEANADSAYATKNYRRAFALFEQLTRIDSTVPRYWMQLGMSAALTNDYKTGARAFERASALSAGPVAAYNTGAMFARLAQPDSAFAWLTRAVQTGFADTTTLATDDDLASIRGDARYAKLRHDAAVAPAPCRDAADNRRFDFWIGNWRVTTAGGQQVGTSHVDVVSGGCALLENWRDMRGSEGKSLNTFDPASHVWRQFWVGQGGGVTDYSQSEWHGSSLTFMAHSRTPNGSEFIQRLTFTPLDGGVVRQFAEGSTDGGKTWSPFYDFHYHPVK
jgi:hypothetical protein